jgi:hypothetical protein
MKMGAMMAYSILAAMIALAVSSANATAAGESSVAIFNGEISGETVDAFLEKYRDHNHLAEFSVASQGGDSAAALKLARWIRSKKLDVRVRSLCFSACANYLFIAGEKKFIESGAFVAWHGDAEQKDFRDLVSNYAAVLAKRDLGQELLPSERSLLEESRLQFIGLTALQREQADFYKLVGVDPMMGRYGQEPIQYPSDAWTFTVPAMKLLGIKNVIAESDYGKDKYFRRAGPAAAMMNGGPLMSFDTTDGLSIMPLTP